MGPRIHVGRRGLAMSWLLALCWAVPTACFGWGDELKAIAGSISDAAARSGVRRVAVLPFAGDQGGADGEEGEVAERLTAPLVRGGKVEVVERRRLAALMEEQRLMVSGAVSGPGGAGPGGLLPADAVVTGSVSPSADATVVHVRLVALRTGKILAAGDAKLPGRPRLDVPVPALGVPVPELPEPVLPGPLRDSLNDPDCARNGSAIDELERGMLDAKAAYWAARTKAPGFSPRMLIANPGSEIAGLDLRSRFYERVRYWKARPDAPKPSGADVARLRSAMGRILSLTEACGGDGAELERALRQIEEF